MIPKFATIFEGFGKQLPAYTRILISSADYLAKYWLPTVMLLFILIVLIHLLIKKSASFKYHLHALQLKLPIFGNLYIKANVALFTQTLAITLNSGLPILKALEISGTTLSNLVYKKAIDTYKISVSNGQPLHQNLDSTLFPSISIQIIRAGEISGTLDEMLNKLSVIYEEEVNMTLDGLSTLIEPILMVIIGTIIGGMILAIYLPIFQLGDVM